MIEIEIRARVQNLELVKERLRELNAKYVKTERQADYIFGRVRDLDGEHKIIERRFTARIREKDDKRLLEFKEIRRNGIGMEFSSPLSDLESGLNFLGKLDFEKAFTVSKVREIYSYQDFEICLDDVEQLGLFIEIEYPCKDDGNKPEALKECQNLLSTLVPGATIEPKKYGDLMQEIINRNNK